MDIRYREQDQSFILENEKISYVFQIVKGKYLMHCYFGKRLKNYRGSCKNWLYDRGFCTNPDEEDRTFSLDTMLSEYPDFGQGDYRHPAYRMESEDGDGVTRFFYDSYEIKKGKKVPEGLPGVYAESEEEAMTLEVTLLDKVRGARLKLCYTIYRDYPAVTRSARIVNEGSETLTLENLMSMSMDLQDSRWDVVTLGGAHTKEKNIYRRRLAADTILLESSRGTSSPQATPFIGLVRPETTEASGEAIGINLIYSGNFAGYVQKSQYGTVRVQLGLNPETFRWRLRPGESFVSPEAVLVYGDRGLQSMSEAFHGLYKNRVCRGRYRNAVRPIVFNSWEAMYFQVSEEKILPLARQAAELGMEVFVLDDGWFSGRNTDTTSLGDWETDEEKFPRGLSWLSEQIEALGMKPGIWFEPEMISEKSRLYQRHPDWVIRSKRYRPVPGRCQYVLDLSNPEVCDYLIASVSRILREGRIAYVKWDMNRHLTDLHSAFLPGERQGELSHRYVLGLYRVLEELQRSFPDVLWEGCSSGGGRYDAGMLYYMPQTWASDNTDAICRLQIQQGTSMLFPPITMCSHVSAVPNHQVGRITPLETRFHVAMSGNLGYELDLNILTEEEKRQIAEQTAFYKKIRRVIQFGTYFRLTDFFSENQGGWEFVSEDGKEVLAVYVQVLSRPAYEVPVLYLRGLEPEAEYACEQDGAVYGGDELMYAGLTIPRTKSDFSSRIYHFTKVNREEN